MGTVQKRLGFSPHSFTGEKNLKGTQSCRSPNEASLIPTGTGPRKT